MIKDFPYLAMDSAGKRTILCDHPVKMFDNTYKETKMSRVLTTSETMSHAMKLTRKLLGQDSAYDDETAEKLKGFLKSRLSAEDHEHVCNMLAGGDVGAEDEPPDTIGIPPRPIPGTPRVGGAAADAAFNSKFPGLAHIRVDNSGLPIPKRAARASGTDAASFNIRYPGLAKIRLA